MLADHLQLAAGAYEQHARVHRRLLLQGGKWNPRGEMLNVDIEIENTIRLTILITRLYYIINYIILYIIY